MSNWLKFNMKNKYLLVYIISSLLLTTITIGCKIADSESQKQKVEYKIQNKGHELVYGMVQHVGTYQKLIELKDVSYRYTYQTPDGKKDISIEKYIFDGELSYGKYEQHDRTFADLTGIIEQGYDGQIYWLKHEGQVVDDSLKLKRVAFNRPTNFYWFAMFQKLLDPGVEYNYLGDTTIDNKIYDKVDISFQSEDHKPTDIYRLFINQKTGLVDQFLFTVADFGVMETPLLMQCQYEKVDGLMIPNQRRYKKSTWDAEVTDDPWIMVTWSDISFNNNLTIEDFQK